MDGQIPFAHGHRQVAGAVAGGRRVGSAPGLAEEGGAFVRVMPELMAQNAEEAWGVAEALGDLDRRLLAGEEGAEGFQLPLEGKFRGEEEAGVGG